MGASRQEYRGRRRRWEAQNLVDGPKRAAWRKVAYSIAWGAPQRLTRACQARSPVPETAVYWPRRLKGTRANSGGNNHGARPMARRHLVRTVVRQQSSLTFIPAALIWVRRQNRDLDGSAWLRTMRRARSMIALMMPQPPRPSLITVRVVTCWRVGSSLFSRGIGALLIRRKRSPA